jgi:hypothetical protein
LLLILLQHDATFKSGTIRGLERSYEKKSCPGRNLRIPRRRMDFAHVCKIAAVGGAFTLKYKSLPVSFPLDSLGD